MANKYESFYRDDIERMINDQALKTMEEPKFSNSDSVSWINSQVAMYNLGIQQMAKAMIAALGKMGSEESHE